MLRGAREREVCVRLLFGKCIFRAVFPKASPSRPTPSLGQESSPGMRRRRRGAFLSPR